MANPEIIFDQLRTVIAEVLSLDTGRVIRPTNRPPTDDGLYVIVQFVEDEASNRKATIGRYRVQYVNGDGSEGQDLELYALEGFMRRLTARLSVRMEVLPGPVQNAGEGVYTQDVRIGYLRAPTIPEPQRFATVGEINPVVSPRFSP